MKWLLGDTQQKKLGVLFWTFLAMERRVMMKTWSEGRETLFSQTMKPILRLNLTILRDFLSHPNPQLQVEGGMAEKEGVEVAEE